MPKVRKVDKASDKLVYKGFRAWVVTDGKPLPLFEVKYDDATREATAWIPSEAGKNFSVCYGKTAKSNAQLQDFTARIYLDGHKVAGKIVDGKRRSRKRVMSSIKVSATTVRDFVFSPIELTDDDAFLENPLAAELGKIIVAIRAVRKLREASEPRSGYDCQEVGKIHERSKKGSVHQVKYSEIKVIPPRIRPKYYSTPVDDPITFIFKYQPLEMLRAKGIAPYPISPPEANDDADDAEIAAKERQLLAELKQVRSQKRTRKDIERPVKRAKTEPLDPFLFGGVIDLTEEREEVQKLVKGEVIDLT